jgi:peptide/nickel transport system ATP-binding protein
VALIEVEDLRTYLYTHRGVNRAVDGVSFSLDAGQSLGLVGESGSGKSMTALSILRLVPQPIGRIVSGSIRFNGNDLLELSETEMRRLRGRDISIILQDPLTSLNPLFTIGFQIGEAVGLHQKLTGRAQLDEVIRSLQQVRVAAAETRLGDYPHQFSGGMRQRVVGAIAIACKPQLLIADEATTALDATIQAQYLSLLRDLQRELNLAVLFITHDFGIVAKMCDHVAVMYAGRIVEYADVRAIFNHPAHPYTQALLHAVPKIDSRIERLYAIPGVPATGHTRVEGCPFAPRCPAVLDRCHQERPPVIQLDNGHFAECWRADEMSGSSLPGVSGNGSIAPTVAPDSRPPADQSPPRAPVVAPIPKDAVAQTSGGIIAAEDLRVYFPVRRGPVLRRHTVLLKAVDGVSFQIGSGETLGLVGESGCGKTTTARALLRLESPTAGSVRWQGKDVSGLGPEEMRRYRAGVQAVFQDPYSSMDPRMRVGDFVAEPLWLDTSLSAKDRHGRMEEVLRHVGLRAEDAQLFPHQFSGGQRQRLAIARALVSSPSVIVLDEPVSSLDVSIRAQIMNLLKELQAELGLSYLFIAHHLGTVRYMSDIVAVMYLGRIVELAPAEEIFLNPLHPYTRALLSAALPDHPDMQRDEVLLKGDVGAATDIPAGCRLHPRCPFALPQCAEVEPEWRELSPGHWAACHLY